MINSKFSIPTNSKLNLLKDTSVAIGESEDGRYTYFQSNSISGTGQGVIGLYFGADLISGKFYIDYEKNNTWNGKEEIKIIKHKHYSQPWNPPGVGKNVLLSLNISDLNITNVSNILSISIITGSTNAYATLWNYDTNKININMYQVIAMNEVSVNMRVLISYIK